MSSVLQASALPTLLNMEELKTYIQSEIQKGIEKALSSKNYVSIEEHNTLKASYIDTVELLANAMKRITQLENALFLQDSEGEIIRDDNDNPVISPKIESEVIADAEKELFIPSGKTEKGAIELIKYAATMKPFNGGKFINGSLLHHIIEHVLPDDLKPTKKGSRVWKQEIIKIVKRIVPDARTDKQMKGNRGIRIIFPRDFNIKRLNVSLV